MYNKKITPSQISCFMDEENSEMEIFVDSSLAATVSSAELDFDLAFEVLKDLGYKIETY